MPSCGFNRYVVSRVNNLKAAFRHQSHTRSCWKSGRSISRKNSWSFRRTETWFVPMPKPNIPWCDPDRLDGCWRPCICIRTIEGLFAKFRRHIRAVIGRKGKTEGLLCKNCWKSNGVINSLKAVRNWLYLYSSGSCFHVIVLGTFIN